MVLVGWGVLFKRPLTWSPFHVHKALFSLSFEKIFVYLRKLFIYIIWPCQVFLEAHGILTTEDSREVPVLTFMMEINLIFKILPVSMIKIFSYLKQVKHNNLGRCLICKTSNNSGIISE